jgi:hypothetical protein
MKKASLTMFPDLTEQEVDLVYANINASKGFERKKPILQSINATASVTVTPADNYEGKFVQEVLRYLYVKNRLVSEGLITEMNGIKLQETHYKGSLPLVFNNRPANGDFVGDGLGPNITPFKLEPVLYELAKEITHQSLLESGFAEAFAQGALNDHVMPEKVFSMILEEIYEKVPIENERLFLKGKGRVPTMLFSAPYLGFEDRLLSSANSKKVITPNTAILATSNVGGFLAFTVGAGKGANFEAGDLIEARGIVDGGGGNLGVKMNAQIHNLLPYDEFNTEDVAIRLSLIHI